MKFLVAGCGSIGKRHIGNLKALKADDIIAHDVSPERCHEVERECGVEAYGSLEDALAQRPDAALICTPTSLHILTALSAANNGCHLFIEKPLSHSLDGVNELINIVTQQRLTTLVGCNMRFHPGMVLIKELLDRKSIGRVICARVQAGQYLPDWHPREDYRQGYSARKQLGGGVILDGIHEIDYLTWLLGEASRVFCFSGKLSSLDIDTEDTAEILLGFKSGVIAEAHLDYVQRTYARSCQIIGEEGTILWNMSEGQVRLYTTGNKEWQVFPQRPDYEINQMYIDEMRHFMLCLEGKAEPEQDVNSARRALEIALAAKGAAMNGCVVELGES